MARKELKVDSVAEAYLALLAERGVEYLFANAGTDFAPIVEAYAKAAHTGLPAPKPLIATHENLAMSMAHGYAVASGKVPAVMVHVSVGTANPLKVGQSGQVSFELFIDGKATVIATRSKVTYCIFSNGEFKIGFQFINLDLSAMAVLAKFLR